MNKPLIDTPWFWAAIAAVVLLSLLGAVARHL